METQGDSEEAKLTLKSSKTYRCEVCDYITLRKWNMNKHVLSAKHLFFTKKYHKSSKEAIKVVKVVKNHKCPFCSKMFKSRGGKYKHIKKCFDNPEILKKKN